MAFGNGPRIVTEGLVLAVDAADRNSYAGSGNVWNSLGTGDYTGTLTNGPTFSAADGGSILFDGTNDFINSSISPVTSPFSFYTGSFTLETIIKPIAYQTGSFFGLTNMVMFKSFSANTFNYAIQLTSDTTVSFIKRGSTESLQFHTFTVPSMRNRISSIIFTINAAGTTVTCYFNGNLIGSLAITGTLIQPSANDILLIGGLSGTLATHFTGNIYGIRIYNIPLSAAQVAQNVAAVKSRYTLQTPTNITSDQAISIAIFNDAIELYPQLLGYTSYSNANAFALVLDS
jgi:hypothetical protein